jgi:hypothetical protein
MTDELLAVVKSALNEQVFEAPLSEVYIDYSWNVRSGNWQDDLDELETSMMPDGPDGRVVQDQPVVVRPHPCPEPGSPPYALVSGFSRCTCIRRIADRQGVKDPKVWLIIRMLDEGEALAMNLRENLARNQVKQADIAVQLWKLYRWTEIERGVYLQPEELAPLVGSNPIAVARMLEVMRKGSNDLIQLWQNSRTSVNLLDLVEIVRNYNKLQQKQAFHALLLHQHRIKPTQRASIRSRAGQQAYEVGTMLAVLENEGYITINNSKFEQYMHLLVRVPSRGQHLRKFQLCRVLKDAYNEARSATLLDHSQSDYLHQEELDLQQDEDPDQSSEIFDR